MSDRSKQRKPQTLTLTLAGRMIRRPLALAASAASILLILFLYSLSPSSPPRRPPSPNPAKIYVYDLPDKFTSGVVRSYHLARRPSPPVAGEEPRYPGHQHSAEWHLLLDLNRADRYGSPLARTFDPDEADLFFVPFFSSLSLIVNPIRPLVDAGVSTAPIYSDEAMQEELVEWLEGQEHWKRNNGRDHVLVCQDPNALYKVMDRVSNGVLLVSDFGRLRAEQASLVKDVILPYSHRINSYSKGVGVQGRGSLLFFMGNRYRKEVQGSTGTVLGHVYGTNTETRQGGKIRDTLFQILEDEKDVIIKHGAQSRESRRMATQGMHSSKFCLHPAGDTPSACRLFDAIVSLCIPVIVSDNIEFPFEDVIDYKKIAIFVDTNTAVKPGYLTSMLREISTKRILQYQQNLQAVKHYFEYEDPNGTVKEIWRQVSLKLPLIKLLINRDKRLVKNVFDGPDCSCVCSRKNGTVPAR